MLTPEQLDEAGELVAAEYRKVEQAMLDDLADTMLSGLKPGSMTVTEAALLGQSRAPELRRILSKAQGSIDAAVQETVRECLEAGEADNMERMGFAAKAAAGLPSVVQTTVEQVAEILSRDNLAMQAGAVQAFLRESSAAITRVNVGAETAERAIHRAVRQLERGGITTITYRNAETGMVTVSNAVDVAVRRHVRTQIAQAGGRRTVELCERYGVELVEVSSHANARPSHQDWQGRIYGLSGPVEVDGTLYDGLADATGYGSVDGLLGANCRHDFGPWLPGTPRAYSPDPEHASGLDSGEVYALEQKQRYRERKIRECKRELRGAALACRSAAKRGTDELYEQVQVAKAKQKLAKQQAAMRELIAEANAKSKTGKAVLYRHPAREWAGDMPRNPLTRQSSTTRNKGRLVRGTVPTSQKEINGLMRNELKGIRFITSPSYNPRIKSPGKTRYAVKDGIASITTEIGKQYKEGKAELADTLIHEELEARIMRNLHSSEKYYRLNEVGSDERHEYINRVVAKYVKMKKWK